jgi:endoglucanase
MDTSLALIKRLSLACGPSGFESEVTRIITENLEGIGSVETDAIGNVVCTISGQAPDAPAILFAAHQDEIGFMVSEVLESGFLRFTPIGGWNALTLPASPVDVIGRDGRAIPGVIGQLPPHFLKKGAEPQVPGIDELFIDIGASSAKEVEEHFGVLLGSIILPSTRFSFDGNSGCIMSKAFDDRIGVAALIELAYKIVDFPVGATVILAFTVQEEVGTRGVKVLANRIASEVAVVVEGAPADDVPGFPAKSQTCVGMGAHVRLFDPTHIGHPGVLALARTAARARGIRIQEAVRKGGGTDAMVLALADRGIPTIVTGVPVRYAHSHNCVASLGDYRELVSLLFAMCQDMTRPS